MAEQIHWWTERWLECRAIYLSIFLSIHPFVCLSAYLSIYLFLYPPMNLSPYPSSCLSTYISIYLSICLSLYLFIYLSVYPSLSVSLSLSFHLSSCKLENEAILHDFLNFRTWQRQNRNKSARLPQVSKLTTSKTKQFWETSFKNGKLSAELTASYQCVLQFLHSVCLKYCACHEKMRPGCTKCCTCHAKSSQQTWRSDAPKCNPSHEISSLTS